MDFLDEYWLKPEADDPRLTRAVRGWNERGEAIETFVAVERAFTLFLNAREIVTLMTIGDHPEELALGYLLNQNMLRPNQEVSAIDVDDTIGVIVVRTPEITDFEEKLRKKITTSGCAQGTVFGDLMGVIDKAQLPSSPFYTSWLYALTHKINQTPSLYLKAGAIHGCVLAEQGCPRVYMEDVGRHNAVDKIAGYMFRQGITAQDKIFYTTGRLTSEMVIKTVRMGIPVLISRSGFTAWGVELARKAGLTLIGRARGQRFMVLAGEERVISDVALPTRPNNANDDKDE